MQFTTTNLSDINPEKILFCSDFHLNHDKEFLWGKRACSSADEHKQKIYEAWDTYVDDETVVFHLGDSHFRDGNGAHFDEFSRLPAANIFCLWGNHNSGAKTCYRKALEEFELPHNVEVYPMAYNNVVFLGDSHFIRHRSQVIFLSHFAHRIWDGMGKNVWHLHGHSHGSDKERLPDSFRQKALDVGVEVAINYHGEFNPFFTLNDIRDIMKKKKFVQQDHHDFSTSSSRKF